MNLNVFDDEVTPQAAHRFHLCCVVADMADASCMHNSKLVRTLQLNMGLTQGKRTYASEAGQNTDSVRMPYGIAAAMHTKLTMEHAW